MLSKLLTVIWRSLTALAALLLLGIFIVVPLAVYFGLFHQSPPHVNQNSALVIRPAGNLVEQAPSGIQSVLDKNFSALTSPPAVPKLIRAIDKARHDVRIKKLYLRLDRLGEAEPGQLQDIVRAIDRFEKSGKPVIAWADNYDQARYELASHANTITLDPMGQVLLSGYGVYRNYFADAINKLGIKIHVFRHGKYKSFVEPLIRNDMSPAAKKANKTWTNSLWQSYRQVVTAKRPIDADVISHYADHFATRLAALNGDGAKLAKKSKLVDKIAPWPKIAASLAKPHPHHRGQLTPIDSTDYLAALDAGEPANDSPEIARIVVSGDITSGGGQSSGADSQTLTHLFKKARTDDRVKAVLLRVDSPGGGINASEAIRRQVVETQAAGKPVIVSMAGVAASGGYWISMNANQIWAEPTTITGSIGVFGLIPTASKPLNKLGIHSDGVGTTPLSGLLRINHPLTDRGRKIMQSSIDFAYTQFVTKVAAARNLATATVKANAKGRVWSGRAAKHIGLVDHLGGPIDAARALAKLAGLESGHYHVETLEQPPAWDVAINHFLSAHVEAKYLPTWLTGIAKGTTAGWLTNHLNDPNGRYARCFCRVAATARD